MRGRHYGYVLLAVLCTIGAFHETKTVWGEDGIGVDLTDAATRSHAELWAAGSPADAVNAAAESPNAAVDEAGTRNGHGTGALDEEIAGREAMTAGRERNRPYGHVFPAWPPVGESRQRFFEPFEYRFLTPYPYLCLDWTHPHGFWPWSLGLLGYGCQSCYGNHQYGYPRHPGRYDDRRRESENPDLSRRLRDLGESGLGGHSRPREPLQGDARWSIGRSRSVSSFELRQSVGRRW